MLYFTQFDHCFFSNTCSLFMLFHLLIILGELCYKIIKIKCTNKGQINFNLTINKYFLFQIMSFQLLNYFLFAKIDNFNDSYHLKVNIITSHSGHYICGWNLFVCVVVVVLYEIQILNSEVLQSFLSSLYS